MKQHIIERLMYVILVLIFIAAGIAGYFALQAVNSFNHQQEILQQEVDSQKQVLKSLQTIASAQGETTKDVNQSLSCILTLFAQPNRTNYYISDFTNCTITNVITGKSEVLPIPNSGALKSGVPNAKGADTQTSTAGPNSIGSDPAQTTTPRVSTQARVATPAPKTTAAQDIGNAVGGLVNGVGGFIGGVGQAISKIL